MLDAVHDVRNYRRGGGQLAGALAVEYDVAGAVAAYHDAVEYVIDVGELAFVRNKHRRDDDVDGVLVELFDGADQLDHAAPCFRIFHISRFDLGDTLGMYRVGIDMLAEREGGEDTDLAACVMTLDVRLGIAFRIAQLLCELERFIKAHTLMDHLGEDEVSGAVEDARDLADVVRDQTLVDRTDDRDAAADSRLKHEVGVLLGRNRQQLRAVGGDQLFVGGDDALAVAQTFLDELIGGM